ncbi:hypothetical protein IAT38_004079 [Cryptococcus sp. DSM 104549]
MSRPLGTAINCIMNHTHLLSAALHLLSAALPMTLARSPAALDVASLPPINALSSSDQSADAAADVKPALTSPGQGHPSLRFTTTPPPNFSSPACPLSLSGLALKVPRQRTAGA